ncbi:bifunctional oligoribonuclease/PAP phosphatase NrnA [Aldersonia sp. NBC_00410]|uniref:DHH family phosphoesterase n=1 Tax=Aldersonia sp. NBC_00410 TaxID=2975954 RepID=UPI002257D51C|nr:bifunctional oligoribonuclease/PAP phosphatase NrnA [Aldersonia sp. NBC_00410]MCX5046556.1 bifunctional oligoribonuclease/PAP phosphatase NrnA [Aldersonia sp. NBC_00410]
MDAASVPDLEAAVTALGTATSVTVLCHINPDADSLGSGLALALALRGRAIAVQVAFAEPDDVPVSMRSLPGVEFVVPADEVAREVDLLVTVDCASAGRLGSLRDRLDGARTTLVIDHHRSNVHFGALNVIDPAAESTTSVVARLLDALDIPIDRAIAHCLFAGLVTDTGSFRWVQPGTHRFADRLLDTGIDGAEITRELLDTHPFGWLPMLSRVLGSARLVPEAHGGAGLVYAVVRTEDTTGLRSEEVESVIDIVRTTSEAVIAAVLKQSGDGSPQWSVSLRSRDGVDVGSIATGLGGGGHRFAAGYTAYGSAEDVVADLRLALD